MMNKHIAELLHQLTLDEKISLLAGADAWNTVAIPRLGIPALKVSDGPNGARGASRTGKPTSACFPAGIALAATWNPALVQRVGVALAEETRSKNAHILLAPTVNMHRSPLAGRNFECYSEDPHLSGRMAVAYITGLQSRGIGACIKHYVCNDSEFERQSISSEVRERTLREIYLKPFEMAIREAHPWSLMTAYNRINGTHASEHDSLLLEVLKGEWGFDGLVLSDWYGTYSDRVPASGLDLEMPGPARWMDAEHVSRALESGTLSQDALDDKVRRLLRIIKRVGAFDQPEGLTEQAIDKPEHRALIREAHAEAMVLLKNQGDILPLAAERLQSIAVIGQNGRLTSYIGGGSASVSPHYVVSPLEGIRARAGDGVAVGYQLGCSIRRTLPAVDPAWLAADDGSPRGLTLTYYQSADLSGTPVHQELSGGMEIQWFGNFAPQVDSARFSVAATGTLTVPETGVYRLGLLSVGLSRLYLDGKLLADAWAGAAPLDWKEHIVEVELLAGQPANLRIEYAWDAEGNWRFVRLGCQRKAQVDHLQEAVALAARSDVAIVFAGLTAEWEGEGSDRPDWQMPGDQDGLIEAVVAANPRTVVVINSGGPVAMPWIDRVPAVLQAWYGGQETGNALADVLFGDADPGGRLPLTLPRRLEDNPAHLNYPGENGQVFYGEGIFIGYRYYDKKNIAPLFPFGHGLSYTSFAYDTLRLSTETLQPGHPLEISLEVTNTGNRAGSEVVQLYVRDVEARVARPEKELKAFAKVNLAPGETQPVTFTLDEGDLSFYDTQKGSWVAEPGEFELLVGRSAADTRLRTCFELELS